MFCLVALIKLGSLTLILTLTFNIILKFDWATSPLHISNKTACNLGCWFRLSLDWFEQCCCVSSADPGLAADRGHHGLGPGHRHHQAGQPPLARGVLHPRMGLYCTVLYCTLLYCRWPASSGPRSSSSGTWVSRL